MVPNVFGMSQYASNIMMTRPYFASSNYINKMSTYKKDNIWNIIWDALYYNFINKHHNILRKNYATAPQVKHWDNKTVNEQNKLIEIATNYLKQLFN
jgi:deoxyribodipyrimidine photolyase-related protein